MYTHLSKFTFTYIYIYVYLYIYMHTYIYVHIHMYTNQTARSLLQSSPIVVELFTAQLTAQISVDLFLLLGLW